MGPSRVDEETTPCEHRELRLGRIKEWTEENAVEKVKHISCGCEKREGASSTYALVPKAFGPSTEVSPGDEGSSIQDLHTRSS